MAIILSLFDKIIELNWFSKKNYQIDSVNSMYDPESPKVIPHSNSDQLIFNRKMFAPFSVVVLSIRLAIIWPLLSSTDLSTLDSDR